MSEDEETKGTAIDYLSEDELPEGSHKFACYSFLSPEGIKNCTLRGLKVRGTFPTEKRAREECEKIREKHPKHDIYVGPVGLWVPFDADPNSCKDQVYQEKELQELSKAYQENQEKGKEMENQRRQEMMQKAILESKKSKKEKAIERCRNKLNKNRAENKSVVDTNEEEEDPELKKKSEEMKEETKEMNKENNKLVEAESGLKTLDEKIARLKEQYAKMKK